MRGHLHFICPTDHLEPLINKNFKAKNYFVSTLGNSLVLDMETMLGLVDLLDNNMVTKITFVLANDNSIIKDAVEKKAFSDIEGIDEFYDKLQAKKRSSELLYKVEDRNSLIIAYHLNEKIKELQDQLSIFLSKPVSVDGKLYNRMTNAFETIYSDLIFGGLVSLN